MAQMPIEIISIGELPGDDLARAITAANTIQREIVYSLFPEDDLADFQAYAFNHALADDILQGMLDIRNAKRGYHPYMIAFLDTALDGNIFGSDRPKEGLAVFTIANVSDVIVPRDRLVAYFLYYLAKPSLCFLVPDHENHTEARGCVYDEKINKRDLLRSMRARAFCDQCRRALLEGRTISARQFIAIDKLFAACGDLLAEDPRDKAQVDARPRAFIGSSVGGLPIAQKLRRLLASDLAVEIWNEGTVFGLGDATLEALERAVLTYDFGLFVFTPDDQLHSHGELKPVARDNVLFELGLFIGKLTRRRAFVIHPSKKSITLPSDLAGITTAQYDPAEQDLESVLAPACERIRGAIRRTSSRL